MRLTTNPVSIRASGTGTFSATFTVPASTTGGKTVTATDAATNSGSATFTVTTPSIALSPNNGPVGTSVTVSGTNFVPSSALTVTYGGVTVDTSTSTASGALPSGVTFLVPESTFGSHAVVVTDGSGNSATATFTVSASITLSPVNGLVGSTATVSGQGFTASSTITVTFGGLGVTTNPIAVQTNTFGSFSCSFTVPSSTTGAKSVQASDGTHTATAVFTVNPGPLDHFTLTASGGGNILDQTVNTAFNITVTAYDINNNIKTDYAGPATLTDLSSSIAPSSTGAFTNGAVTVSVTIANSFTNDRITATSGAISTQSNVFTVHNQVTYVSAGTGSGTTGNPTPTYPTGLQANDLIILQVTVRDTTTTPTTPTGFTLLYGPDSTGTGRQWLYYHFSTGSESGSLTINIGGATCKIARMYTFRNVALTSFNEGGGFGSGTGNTISAQSVTTTGYGELAVSFVLINDNNAVNNFSGETGGNWQEATAEYTSAAGNHGTMQLQIATMANAGTISGGTTSSGGFDAWGVRAFALRPA